MLWPIQTDFVLTTLATHKQSQIFPQHIAPETPLQHVRDFRFFEEKKTCFSNMFFSNMFLKHVFISFHFCSLVSFIFIFFHHCFQFVSFLFTVCSLS